METENTTTQFEVSDLDDINQYSVDLGWDVIYTQLGSGIFHGAYTELLGHSVAATSETWSLPVALKMSGLPGFISLAIFLSDEPAKVNGFELRSDQIVLSLPGADVHVTTSSAAVAHVAHFPESDLVQKLGDAYHLINKFVSNVCVFDISRIDKTNALKDWFLRWLSNPGTTNAMALRGLTHSLYETMYGAIDNIAACLSQSDQVGYRARLRKSNKLFNLIEYLYFHTDEVVTIDDMTRHTGLGRRNLFYNFHRYTDYTPNQYFKLIRLGSFRRELLAENGHITQLGAKYNFHHPGDLSAFYKKIYGESPSDSLRKTLVSMAD